jgi:hypothetical protein
METPADLPSIHGTIHTNKDGVMKFTKRSLVMLAAAAALLLAGCTGPAPTATPTAQPTQAAATATPQAAALATLTPTPAPTQAAATATSEATAAPENPASGGDEPIRFEPGTVNAEVSGRLEAGAAKRYQFTALKGQIVTVELTVDPDTADGLPATITVTGVDGTVLITEPTTRWKGTVLTSQEYIIVVQSAAQQVLSFKLLLAIPAAGSTPYVTLPESLCQSFQESAAAALKIPIQIELAAPFMDEMTGETGQGCALTGSGTGSNFESPAQAVGLLKEAFLGFTELPAYQADGPTGTATALSRDSAILIIRVSWEPAPGTDCPSDQPISACSLKPEQKLYTISIQGAMK